MRNAMRMVVAALALVAAVVVVGGKPADAAGEPVLVNNQGLAPPTGNQQPAVASDGTNALVVWEKTAGQNGRGDIFGRLTATDGSTPPAAFRISLTGQEEALADVAWNGSSYLVVWEAVDAGGNRVIRGRRVSMQGALLGSQLAISPLVGEHLDPTLAAGPNGQFLVAWEDARNAETTSLDIFGRRITSSGGLLDGTGTRISDDGGSSVGPERDPDVAWNGQQYLVVWQEHTTSRNVGELDSSVVLPDGRVDTFSFTFGGTTGTSRNYSLGHPAIAAAGRVFFITFTFEEPPNGDVGIFGARWDPEGGASELVTVAEAANVQDQPAIAFNGKFMVVWTDRRNGADEVIWGTWIGPDGTVDEPGGRALTDPEGDHNRPALTKGTSTAQTFTLAWQSEPSDGGVGIDGAGLRSAPK